jgi:hypothetical protein
MAGTAITTTGQDITGDFDMQARLTSGAGGSAIVMKSQGTGSTDWVTLCTLRPGDEPVFVKNSGTNAYKLAASVTGVVVEFVQ